MNNNNETYGWIFHQNLDGIWCAAKREYYFELFNGEKGNVLKSANILDLVALINRTKGDKAEIQKLLDGKITDGKGDFFFNNTFTNCTAKRSEEY